MNFSPRVQRCISLRMQPRKPRHPRTSPFYFRQVAHTPRHQRKRETSLRATLHQKLAMNNENILLSRSALMQANIPARASFSSPSCKLELTVSERPERCPDHYRAYRRGTHYTSLLDGRSTRRLLRHLRVGCHLCRTLVPTPIVIAPTAHYPTRKTSTGLVSKPESCRNVNKRYQERQTSTAGRYYL